MVAINELNPTMPIILPAIPMASEAVAKALELFRGTKTIAIPEQYNIPNTQNAISTGFI
jgi:hypothetical protein